MPDGDSMPFPVVAFIECGFRFPLNILFRKVLHYYKLNPMQLAINSYRVINALPQPPKDFHKTCYPSKDFKKLLGLPVNQRKAPLLLNYILTYKSTLPDVPKKSNRKRQSVEASASDPANPPTALLAIHFGTRVTIATTANEIGCNKAVVEDLLADIPGVVIVQSSPSQSQPKPKQKRVKRAKEKASFTQVEFEDTVPISKLAEIEKTSSVAEKRPAEDDPSETAKSKKLSQSEAKAGEEEDEEEEDDEEAEVATNAAGSAGDEEDEVQKTISEAEVETANKSLDDTLREIDAEVEANKSVTPPADEANPNT
ncbi:transcription initiation factor TFIID subunit 11-like [Camellia sinensis]|uniref:transcription initiation factor TFIID subunit 11-like n=1 Tax=Camellia sinensis TaxID=4442 RepID=UPI0010358874|nr:transcription initiation factor TFIID subunit 11-like [Camellia sinensis]